MRKNPYVILLVVFHHEDEKLEEIYFFACLYSDCATSNTGQPMAVESLKKMCCISYDSAHVVESDCTFTTHGSITRERERRKIS